MNTTSDMAKALRQALQTIPMLIPAEANNNLRDFLFGEGAWEEPCPFCTKTYPAIIQKLKAARESSNMGDFFAGNVTDSSGVTTIIRTGSDGKIFGSLDKMDPVHPVIRATCNSDISFEDAKTLEIREVVDCRTRGVLVHWGKEYASQFPFYGYLGFVNIRNMPELKTLKVALSRVKTGPYSYGDNWRTVAVGSVSGCPNLETCEITSFDGRGYMPYFYDISQRFTLDLRGIGIKREDLNSESGKFQAGNYDYFGVAKARGTIRCVDGDLDFL